MTEVGTEPRATFDLRDAQGPAPCGQADHPDLADQIRPFVPRRYQVLGTDGFGRSDYRRKLRAAGGFSKLGTSIPPQSPVAWANFINGAGPGSHGREERVC